MRASISGDVTRFVYGEAPSKAISDGLAEV